MEPTIRAGDWGSAVDGDRTRFVGAGAAEADVDGLPDPDVNPGPNEDWPSHRGDTGHARYIPDGHEFDGEELEAAWSVAGAGAGTVAVADETVYTPTDDDVVDGNSERAARTITETATAILEVPWVSIWLFEDDCQRLRCVDQYEQSTQTHSADTEFEATEFPTYVDALRSHRSFAVDEARDDPRTEELTDPYLVPNDIYSLLDATLHDEGEVIGVVCHEQTDSTREWTDTERQLATEIADIDHRAVRNHRSRRQRK
ncbi:GAF domain-containing protein [Natrinema sp. DC36]|uniref:GAF domain-containing protein n=1 Tax=Natrinema sp. DC36 TaxID=2878680 RepID=UPI001CF0429B|nr:GAF domain-containing protein [Natrinema sp. DC36]